MTTTNFSCPTWDDTFGNLPELKRRNAIGNAYRLAISIATRKIVELDDIKQWHNEMFGESVPLDYYAGNFRQLDSNRECLAVNVSVAGIPGEDYRRTVQELELLFSGTRSDIATLETRWPNLSRLERSQYIAVIIGNLIGGFIRIHPFINGNGRLSRVVWAAALTRFGVPPQFRIAPRPPNCEGYGNAMSHAMQGDNRPAQLLVWNHLARNNPKVD